MTDRRVVYSSEQGRLCPGCGYPQKECRCSRERPAAGGDGIVRIRREVKGRRGKTVTTVAGLDLDPDRLRNLASSLKKACGAGGGVKNGVIEIQGDHRMTVAERLTASGYKVRQAGG